MGRLGMNQRFKRIIAVFALLLVASSGVFARGGGRGRGGRGGGWHRGGGRHHGGRHHGGRGWHGRGWRRGGWGWGGGYPYWGYGPSFGVVIGGGGSNAPAYERYYIINNTNAPVSVYSNDSGDSTTINPGAQATLAGNPSALHFTINGRAYTMRSNNIVIEQGRYGRPVPRVG